MDSSLELASSRERPGNVPGLLTTPHMLIRRSWCFIHQIDRLDPKHPQPPPGSQR